MKRPDETITAKPHYVILDGLRGVAALMVIWYHVFEGFATSPVDQKFNHGYLAVDFFFILSGFVIGYAYDDRWKSMDTLTFLKRRLIRLHPMLVIGAVFGVIAFLMQGSVQWDGTHIGSGRVMLAFLLSILLIPSLPGGTAEVRGNGEMFPLNGPSWSLFFEYIGNIMYALFLRRLSTRILRLLVIASGIGYALFSTLNGSGYYSMGVGWSLADLNLLGGFLRLTFSFSCGLLMSREFKPAKIKGAFWICAVMIVSLLSVPYIGHEANWLNGLYDAACTLLLFPLIVYMGASGTVSDGTSSGICTFLGNISYPVYIIHYPMMYLFYSWLWKNGLSFSQTWPVAVLIFAGSLILAYACFKYYDQPVRKWLSRRTIQHARK